jgi:hypothetical protein
MTILPPPEKLDVQVIDIQTKLPFQFLPSLLRFGSGWFANPALQRFGVAGLSRRLAAPKQRKGGSLGEGGWAGSLSFCR